MIHRKYEKFHSFPVDERRVPRVAADGILLLLAMLGTAFTVVSAYDIETDALRLGVVCLVMSGLYLFLFSCRRAMLPGVLLTTALWVGAIALTRETTQNGVIQIAGDVLDTLSEVFEVGHPDIPAMSGAARREAVGWALAMAMFPLGGFLACSVIYARSPILTVLLTASLFLPAILADVVPDRLPLMTLVLCYCLLILTSLSARMDPLGSARFTFLCLPFAVLLLAALTVLVTGDYSAPRWVEQLRVSTTQFVSGLADNHNLSDLLPSGSTETTVHLDEAGPRQFTGETMFTVSGDTEGRVYLRGISAASYTGSAWEPLDEKDYESIGLDGKENLILGVSPLNLPSLTAPEQEYSELRIDYGSSRSGLMYTPYQLSTAPDEIDGVSFHNDAWLSRRFGVQQKNLFYRPDASPATATVLTGAAARAEKVYRNFVYDHYTAVPEDFQQTIDRMMDRVSENIQNNPGERDRLGELYIRRDELTRSQFDARIFMADYMAVLLDLVADYDLNTPYTPDDADFVDYFLNESHRGYCVHFASAGALLLRASNIPARFVGGYTTVIPSSGSVDVVDSDAHAWVEIYIDGYGWYPVDMTPAAGTGIEYHTTLGDTPSEEPEEDEEPPDGTETETEPHTPDEPEPDMPGKEQKPDRMDTPKDKETEKSKLPHLILACLTPLILAALALTARAAVLRELRERRFNGADCGKAVIDAYRYLERLTPWGGLIDTDAVELAQRAKFSQHVITGEERDVMLMLTETQRDNVWDKLPKWKRLRFWLCGL